jgi:hypothetical protein
MPQTLSFDNLCRLPILSLQKRIYQNAYHNKGRGVARGEFGYQLTLFKPGGRLCPQTTASPPGFKATYTSVSRKEYYEGEIFR